MKINKKLSGDEGLTTEYDGFGGTTFYKITEDQLKKFYEDDKNIALRYIVESKGFDAFNTDEMYGSYYSPSEDAFYYCETDGHYISVNGNDEVDPESAMEDYSIEDLYEYIEDGTDDEIRKYFSEYELADIDADDVGTSLVEDGYTFKEALEALDKLDALDDIL